MMSILNKHISLRVCLKQSVMSVPLAFMANEPRVMISTICVNNPLAADYLWAHCTIYTNKRKHRLFFSVADLIPQDGLCPSEENRRPDANVLKRQADLYLINLESNRKV